MKELNNENFKEFTNNKIALVYISAPWCGPCKVLSPVVENVSTELTDINFGKLNADDNREILTELGVRNVPTLILYKDGEIVNKHVGSLQKETLLNFING